MNSMTSQGHPVCRLLVVDEDSAMGHALIQTEIPLPAKIGWVPSQALRWERSDSWQVVLVAEDCLSVDSVQQWLAEASEKGACVLVGRTGGDRDSEAPPPWAHGTARRPYDPEEIHHHVVRALCREGTALAARLDEEKLREAERVLLARRKELESLQRRLSEGQKALGLLAERMDAESREAFQTVAYKVKGHLVPLIKNMHEDPAMAQAAQELEEILSCTLRGVGHPESLEGRMIAILSSTELRIAALIRLGVSSHEIAERLGISTATVQTHRKNIRKKLGLQGRHYSLRHSLAQNRESGFPLISRTPRQGEASQKA